MNKEIHADALPVRLVILFVGVIGVLSLLIGAWLFWLGKGGESVLAITNGCVMGLLGLLARTESRSRQERTEPVEVTATEPLPVENVNSEADEPDESTDNPDERNYDERNYQTPSPLAKAVRK